ncbi:MAG: LLM class flavin-dependent oxidoreductase [Chloroflexi bacterium]|nr:LLM class flavin-dependent oxidoreductase [Chloroflexota bacterium]
MVDIDFRTPFLDEAAGFLTFAEELERLGYGAHWLAHSIGRDFPRMDTLMLMAGMAARTHRIKLGVGVLQAPLYSPVALGRMLVTLDHLSNGRLILGIGTGWVPKEFANLGVPFEERGGRTDEALEILKRLWTEEEVTYQGRYYTIHEARLEPKPLQRPYPRIIMGGVYNRGQRGYPGEKPRPRWSQRAIRRTARFADGWITPPNVEAASAVEVLSEAMERIRAAGQDAGRTITDEGFDLIVQAGSICIGASKEEARAEAYKAYMSRVTGGFYQVMGNLSFDDMMGACGTADEVAAFVDSWLEVQKGVPALKRIQFDLSSLSPVRQLQRFHAEVQPLLKR